MIELKNVSKTFDSGTGEVDALKNLLEKPSSGEIIVNGERLDTMSPAQLRAARRNITMIFQHFNLLMQRTCLKNICFPMELAGVKKAEAEKRARELLELVGLPDKANAYPAQLSGGQQQRIAIARALATDPKLLLLDEPAAGMNPNETEELMQTIHFVRDKFNMTILLIEHDMKLVQGICEYLYVLNFGRLLAEGTPDKVLNDPAVVKAYLGD